MSELVSFSTTLVNSQFDNWSEFNGNSLRQADLYTRNHVCELIVTNCSFSNSQLSLNYISVDMMIFNSTVTKEGLLILTKCNVEISGTVLFSNAFDGLNTNSLATFMLLSSSISITGDVTFVQTSISAHLSIFTLSGNSSFLNNIGFNGGAMVLYSSTLNIAPNTTVYFYNNTATEAGGAIYVDNDGITGFPVADSTFLPCFYQLLDYDVNSPHWYNISFHNNSATKGGDHIYGALMHSGVCFVDPSAHKVVPGCCAQKYFHLTPSPCIQSLLTQ